jgi:hypothetical protein
VTLPTKSPENFQTPENRIATVFVASLTRKRECLLLE